MPLPALTEEVSARAVEEAGEARRDASLSQRGVAYIAARYGASAFVNAGNVFVLTWWIGPRAYGAFVTAVGITTFLSSVARAGLDTCLVRAEQPPTSKDYDTAFTLILAISLLLCALGILALPLLTYWLPDHTFVLPYIVLLLTIPLIGLAGPPMAQLERALQFQDVAKIEFGGQLAAFVVSGGLAWRGLGMWAPVAGHVTWQLCVLIAAKWMSSWSPRLSTDRVRARNMIRQGLGFSTSVRVWQLRKLVNPLVVGRILGTEAVAFVGLAARAIEVLSVVRVAVERVAIAALSRLRENPRQCQQMMQKGARLDVLVLGPAVLMLTTLGPVLLPGLFGERWSGALRVLPFVTAAALVNSVFALEASALFVEGRQWVVTRAYLWHVLILALGTLLLASFAGIAGYGWAELAACLPYLILHRGLPPGLRIVLPPILPWLGAFTSALLSSLLISPLRWALWLPLTLLAGREFSLLLSRTASASPTPLVWTAWKQVLAAPRRSGASGD